MVNDSHSTITGNTISMQTENTQLCLISHISCMHRILFHCRQRILSCVKLISLISPARTVSYIPCNMLMQLIISLLLYVWHYHVMRCLNILLLVSEENDWAFLCPSTVSYWNTSICVCVHLYCPLCCSKE